MLRIYPRQGILSLESDASPDASVNEGSGQPLCAVGLPTDIMAPVSHLRGRRSLRSKPSRFSWKSEAPALPGRGDRRLHPAEAPTGSCTETDQVSGWDCAPSSRLRSGLKSSQTLPFHPLQIDRSSINPNQMYMDHTEYTGSAQWFCSLGAFFSHEIHLGYMQMLSW